MLPIISTLSRNRSDAGQTDLLRWVFLVAEYPALVFHQLHLMICHIPRDHKLSDLMLHTILAHNILNAHKPNSREPQSAISQIAEASCLVRGYPASSSNHTRPYPHHDLPSQFPLSLLSNSANFHDFHSDRHYQSARSAIASFRSVAKGCGSPCGKSEWLSNIAFYLSFLFFSAQGSF